MKDDKRLEHKPDQENKRSLLGFFFLKNKFDKSYAPDLKQQWDNMDRNERLTFILGVVVGAIIFLLGIALLYSLIFNLIPH